jgi:biotin carboxyl carrier protein
VIYVVRINGNVYEVEVERGEATVVKAAAEAMPAVTVVQAPAAVSPAPAQAPAAASSAAALPVAGEVLRSPMPGAVTAVKVNVGTKVKKGDTILLLEAMKMENELVATADGVVTHIHATKGSNVQTNDILVVIQ